MEENQREVESIIRAIRRQGMTIKPTKCELHTQETEYLGFIINPEGVKVDPIKTSAIRKWKLPTRVKGIQEFMGFCNFYKRFIEEFSRMAKPLYDRIKKGIKWEWGDKEQTVFDKLRKKLCTAPGLPHFKPGRPLIIETDAAKYVCSGIILQ